MSSVLFVLELFGIISFALSGIVEARREKLDVVGVYFAAFITAFGGGTLRDLLIDRHPLWWVQHDFYLLLLLVPSLGASALHIDRYPVWLSKASDLFDAAGTGLFSVVGVGYALESGCGVTSALLLGIITAIFGGVLRDVICNRVPYVFQHTELCATCALLGGIVYLSARQLGISQDVSLPIGALACAILRWLALTRKVRLPL